MPKPTAFAPISKRKESCWKTVLRGPPGAGPDIHSGKADAFRFGRTYMCDDAHGPLQSRHIAPGRLDPASRAAGAGAGERSEEHTSELQSLMRISYAVFCLKKHTKQTNYKYKCN